MSLGVVYKTCSVNDRFRTHTCSCRVNVYNINRNERSGYCVFFDVSIINNSSSNNNAIHTVFLLDYKSYNVNNI